MACWELSMKAGGDDFIMEVAGEEVVVDDVELAILKKILDLSLE